MNSIRVEVVCAWPDRAEARELRLRAGSTVAEAIAAAGMTPGAAAGIHGRKVSPSQVLAEGDRVEIYRPLEVDPKEARRRRARRQALARRNRRG